MFITKEAFNPLLGDMSRFEAQRIAKIFAHEIAHQYWGIVVQMPSPEEQWLTESFAEYCAFLFVKDRRSASVAVGLEKRWRRGADFADDAAPIPLANRVWVAYDAVRRAEIRKGLLYDKGPILLAALHREMGDEAFLAFLKSTQAALAWKFGSTKRSSGSSRPPARGTPRPSSTSTTGAWRCPRTRGGSYHSPDARVAELADARDLGSRGETLEGSSPSSRTIGMLRIAPRTCERRG